MPYDEAVLFAANNLFGKSELPQRAMAAGDKYPLVIDPLIDGNTQAQSNATRDMEARIAQLVQTGYPNFALQPFSTAALARGPILFIGTMTAVDRDGKNVGEASWYRVCLALVDMRTGRIISKGFARAQPQGVDHTPTAFFRDSPATAPDPAVSGYVRTCQGTKVGDLINPDYWDRILAAAMIKDAIAAYEAGRYQEALDIYRGVARIGGGDQLRVYNGIYLAAWKLGQRDAAARAFGDLVDYGFAQNRLGVKFLFRPGTTVFVGDQQLGTQYTMWLQQIASRSVQRPNCMQIAGHTSRTGPEPMNERLSLLRAQFVQQRLTGQAQPLSKRTTTIGRGSADAISGLGTDDLRDAVDRRVEFRVATCT